MKKTEALENEKTGKLLFKFFVPAFVGVFVNALYNIVDRIYIGQGVGADALSGLSVIFPIMLIVIGFGMLIGVGTGVLVSIELGKKDKDKAEKVVGTGFLLMIIISIAVTIIGFVVKTPILNAFGANEKTVGYAQDYLNIILLGTIFQVIGYSLNNVIRSEGNARIAMYTMVISAIANIILDPIFIFVFKMGVKGAAIATVISSMVMMVWVLLHFLKSKQSVVKLKIENINLDKFLIKRIVGIGMAPFMMQIASSLVYAVINKQLIKYGGDLAVGAMGIINSVSTMVVMTIISITIAMQPIIGFNFGAERHDRVRSTLLKSMLWATVISIITWILVQLFPEPIIKAFSSDSLVLIKIGVEGIKIYLLALPLVGFQIVSSSFFQAIGKAKISLFLTVMRQVVFLLPLLFIFPLEWGLKGIWAAGPASNFLSLIMVTSFIIPALKRLKAEGVS